jgi:hypothetical protein
MRKHGAHFLESFRHDTAEPSKVGDVKSRTPVFAFLLITAAELISSVGQAATVHGYVVNAADRRVQGARVQAWHLPPTDLRPPQEAKRLGETITDSHGNFVISVDPREVNILIASFNNQSGASSPSYTAVVRIALRHNRPRRQG